MPSKPSFLFIILLAVAVTLLGVSSADAAKKPKKPKIEKRVKSLETRMGDAEGRLDNLEPRVDALENLPPGQGGGFELQDSTGKVFGKILDTNGQNTRIVITINGILVWLDVHNPTSFDLYTGSNLLFVSSDCTGSPLMHKSFQHMQIATVVQVAPPGAPGPLGNFLFAPIPGTDHTGTAHSILNLEGICLEGLGFPFVAFDAQFIVDLGTVFTPPFTVVGDAPTFP